MFTSHCGESHTALDFLHKDDTRTEVSYSQLHRLSNSLAAKIDTALDHDEGVNDSHKVVPVMLPQSPEFYVSWLAVLKTGAAVCPLNLDTPPERIRFILNDVSAKIVVTVPQFADKLREVRDDITTIFAPSPKEDLDDSIEKHNRTINTHNPAYVMYTSGSTGLPKGVVVSHQAATQALLAHDRHIPDFTRFLQFASPTFDVSVFEIFFPWFRGATLVGCERGKMLSNLPAVLKNMQIDAAEFTPTVAGELVRSRSNVPSLKVMLTIGEMLTRHVIDEFGTSFDRQGILYGMYGPTEAAIHCTVADDVHSGDLVGNIGVPLDTVTAFIIPIAHEKTRVQQPEISHLGHIGELALGGFQLADGYLNRDKENKAAFINLPNHGRIYRTGDKARIHPNGLLECLGRISTDQVKLRGQRIELGEIEQIICKTKGVRNAVVNVVEGILVAFLTVDDTAISSADVSTTCRRWLPRYMVPGDFVILDKLPRLPSAKVDRKLLVADYVEKKGAWKAGVSTSYDSLTKNIISHVEGTLGAPVDVDKSLASQGLDSLSAIKLSSMLRGKGLDLDVTDILDADCINGLCSRVEVKKLSDQQLKPASQNQGFKQVITAVEAELKKSKIFFHVHEIYPCSSVQIAMLTETVRDSHAYFNRIEHEFEKGIQEDEVKKAFRALAQQNEILRTGFLATEDSSYSFVQIVWNDLAEEQFTGNHSDHEDVSHKILHPLTFKFSTNGERLRMKCQVHHSLYDGWSWELVCNDVSRFLSNQTLPKRPQFREVVSFLNDDISSENWERATNYWRDHLQGYQAHRWPNFNSKTDIASGRETLHRTIHIQAPEAKKIAQRLHIGTQAIFQSAFAYLVASYVGNADVVIGSVSSGRTLPLADIEKVIGPCVATVPLRFKTMTMRTSRDLVMAANNLNRQALKHEFAPLQQIKKHSDISVHEKLFHGLFVWQDMLTEEHSEERKLLTVTETEDYLECALLVEMQVLGDSIQATVSFDASAMPSAQAALFLHQLDQITSLIVNCPDQALNNLFSRLSRDTLSITNFPYQKEPYSAGLADGVKATAKDNPERIAIEFGEDIHVETGEVQVQKLTYSELEISSNAVAHRLQSLQVNTGDFVAIYMEKCPELYVSMLAVVKAGAAFVPIAPSTPKARLMHILHDTRCRVVLTTTKISAAVEFSSSITPVNVDTFSFVGLSISAPSISVEESMPAYVIFTSGSTGIPKGVVVTRRNLQTNLSILAKKYPSEPCSKLLQACSQAFDVAVFEVFFTLNRGMTLCATTNDLLFRDIENFIRRMGITHLSMTSTVAALVHPENVPRVRFLISAGESLNSKILQNWGGKGLWQGYGPTETTNIVTLKANIKSNDQPNDIGAPLETTSVFIVADTPGFPLVPRGGVGELCFGGDQVAQGYIDMKDLTTKKFMAHPEFGRIYRTGDFGRMLPNNSLLFLGRQDDQVKFRGQRVELGEIDAVLSRQAEVLDNVTIVQPDQGEGKQQLVSFLKLSGESNINSSHDHEIVKDLFNILETELPPYMVPSIMLPVPSFPLNSSGKKDWRPLLDHLKSLDHDMLDSYSRRSDFSENEDQLSETEAIIASCVSQVTNTPLEDVRKHSSFFSLGLDSISATSLSKSLKSRGLGQIDISKILIHNSVTRLAQHIKESQGMVRLAETSTQGIPLLPFEITEKVKKDTIARGYEPVKVLPCTPLQEAMLARLSESDAYHNVLILELACDVRELEKSWKQAITRHDILRTRFASTYDARNPYVQIVLRTLELPWDMITEDVNLDIENEIAGPHPTSADDLIPYHFFVIKGRKATFFKMDIHHAIYDAAAIALILKDVETSLKGNVQSLYPPFEDYLRYMIASDSPECSDFWKSYLEGVRSIGIDKQKSRGTQKPSFNSIAKAVPLSLDDLLGQCKEMSTTLLSILQTSWGKLLVHLSGVHDLCFGNVYSGRNIPIEGAEYIVGPCFNTLPIRATISAGSINLTVVHQLRDDNLKILPHQLTSLRKLSTQLRRDSHVLFDTLLLLQDDKLRLDDTVWKLRNETGAMDMPLICEVIPDKVSGKVEAALHFDESLISRTDADTLLSAFLALVSHTVLYPYARALDSSFLKDVGLQSVVFKPQEAPPTEKTTEHSVGKWDAKAKQIREVLSELSEVAHTHITLDTTIFQLGLDSINALQLAAKLSTLGFAISAGDILEVCHYVVDRFAPTNLLQKPSVREIAEHTLNPDRVENGDEADTVDFEAFSASQEASMRNIPYAAERTVKLITPCTPVQAGMLASFMNSNGNSYLNHLLLRYDIDVDMASIRKAWESAMDRHDMLRTGFFPTHSRDHPFAMITYATEPLDAHWGSVDCLSPSSEDVSLLRDRIGQEALKNLAKPPWFVSVQNDEAGIFLQFSAHHALYDAQSLSIVLSDISTIIKGGNLLDPKSIRPIHEIIVAEAQSCSSVAKEYWQSMQSNFYVTKFPDMNPNHPRLPYCTYNIASESQHTLPWLQNLCSKANVSLQAACQAAWAKILTAYVGERKVTCGIVMSGRNVHTEAEGAAFPCLVTLPTYYHVEGTNQQLLNHIMVQNAQMTRYQFTPLSKVYEWTNSDSSLFDTLFIYQKFAQNSSEPLPWAFVDEKAEVDYPISLEVVPTKSTLQYNLSFRSDLVPQNQAKLILRQLDCLLIHCLTHLEDYVDNASSLPADMISVTPAKEIEIATPCRLLHGLFEETAARSPSKVALEFITRKGASVQARQWTYAEVDREANKFARLFQQHCASQGGLIAICFDKCPEAYMAILGVLKAGCAYVAIDPTAPAARKKFILEDSRAQLLLAISDTAGDLNSLTDIDVIIVNDSGTCRVFRDDPPLLTNAISQKDPCYCLYTSGTTGTPKGCLITHDNAVQAMLAFQRLFSGHWDESSRWLQFASFHFDVSVLEQYWSWSVGICLVSCPRDLLFEDLPGTLAKLEITHIDLTPSLARLLHPDEVPSLKRGVFITGGEALRQDILDDWGRYNVIYNGYGPTEVTIGCTMFPRVPRNGKPANIGSQFDNVSSYVFRPGTTEPVLRGGIGELCVGGPLVGKGYLNRDDLTRERFISLETFNDRIYRTGDLVRLYHDDTFCFLGRQDDQIKLRGQRLEIGEINETITRSAKEIRGVATIIAKRSEKTKEQLVSFLVTSVPGKSCEAIQLDLTPEAQQIVAIARRACLSALPGYMVPTHIVPLNRMPLSANNKLDVKQLKSFYSSLTPEDLQKLSRSASDTSVTLTEGMKKFIDLVADLLGLDPTKISPESNLFQLGLDSITATTFTKDLRNNGFLDVSSAQVMKNPTLSNLYRVISETNRREKSNRGCYREAKLRLAAFSQANFLAVARDLSISSTGLERVAPCTPLQEGILYQYLQSQEKSYLANFCYEISASVSITRLKQAWNEAQKSILVLRTKFVSTDNGFAQVVLKEMPLPCSDAKVSHDEDYREIVQKQFEKWVDEGNHLSSPWEITFIEGAAKRLMVLNIFHAIYDGISLPHTLREVARMYSETGYTPDKPSLLDALPWVYAIDYPAAEAFWRQHLEKQSARLLLPPDSNNYGQSIAVTHDLTDINLVEGLRRELNVTEQAIFLACWICVATHHFGFLPSLGIVVSGRAIDFDRAQEIMGPMFNTVPCGVSPSGCTAMRTLVQACHDYYASIIPYQHTSLRDIRKWLRKPADSPLFDSLFVFQKVDLEETPLEELWHPVSSDSNQDFSLSFEVQRQRNNRGTVTLATKSGIMTQDIAKKLCTSFDDTLYALMQDVDMHLSIKLPDQGQLKEKDTTRVSSPSEHTESFEWTPLALELREQIAQLADTDASSINESTSIFELGLDSIDAIRLSSRMKSSGALLSVSAIMRGRTIANLVERVSSHTAEENSSVIPFTDLKEQLRQSLNKEVSEIHNAECILPATPLQEAMVAEMVSSDYSRYYNHDVMELAPWVDVDRLRCAWLDVIERNPILRARFVEVSDPKLPYTYAQVVCSGYEDVWAVKEVVEDEIEEHVLNATHRYKP
ncbi:Nonribosomal Peptide Synthase (NRPS), partial [Ascosphaera pollenicola]